MQTFEFFSPKSWGYPIITVWNVQALKILVLFRIDASRPRFLAQFSNTNENNLDKYGISNNVSGQYTLLHEIPMALVNFSDTMKIYSIAVLRREPNPVKIISIEHELSSFNFFQRSR